MEPFVPQVFIFDDRIYQTVPPNHLPSGWVTIKGVPEIGRPDEIVFAVFVDYVIPTQSVQDDVPDQEVE